VYTQGERIIKQGEEGDKFYMIEEGEGIAIQVDEMGCEKQVYEYHTNDYFGELALINDEKRKASIKVTSPQMIVAYLDKNSFKRLLGPMETILKRNADNYAKYMAKKL